MSTSAHESKISRARELGLPTPEDSGNEDKTSMADRASSERQLTGLLDFVRKAAFGMCARVDGDECCFFVKELENFCVTCHARELLDDARTNFRVQPAQCSGAVNSGDVWGLVMAVANGCVDYGGGYRSDDEKLAIFHHGIQTVCNSLEAARQRGLNDTQVAALYRVGIAQDTKSSEASRNPELSPHSPASPESRLKAEEAIRPLFADVSVIRTAIMDALDSESIWDFDDKDVLTDEEATEERVKFADCIEKRIRELQSPPFNLGIKLENYCSRHAMARLPRATASTCADCAIELEKRRINHPD